MAKSEGLTLPFVSKKAIRADYLETFTYRGEKQHITYKTAEFSSVCPFSGLPDYAQLIIDYVPHKQCLELKSLKYYIVSYRNVGIYQENATNHIFKDIYKKLKPKSLKITTIYNTRGGIDSTCSIEKSGLLGR